MKTSSCSWAASSLLKHFMLAFSVRQLSNCSLFCAWHLLFWGALGPADLLGVVSLPSSCLFLSLLGSCQSPTLGDSLPCLALCRGWQVVCVGCSRRWLVSVVCRRNQQIFAVTLCPLILDCSFYCRYHHRNKYFEIISPYSSKIIWTFEKVVYCIPISLPRLSVYICDSLGRSSMVLSLKSFFSSFLSLLSFYYLSFFFFLDRVFSCSLLSHLRSFWLTSRVLKL